MAAADATFTREILAEDQAERSERKWKYVASGKERADQTTQIHQAVREYVTGEEPEFIETVDALNEGNIEAFAKSLMTPGSDDWKKWIRQWHNGTGKLPEGMLPMRELAANFARWFLKELRQPMERNSAVGVEAFSHGPLMLAVLATIEDETGLNIITDVHAGDERFDRDKLLDQEKGILKVMQTLDISVTSTNRDNVVMIIGGKRVAIPLSVFEKIAGKNNKITNEKENRHFRGGFLCTDNRYAHIVCSARKRKASKAFRFTRLRCTISRILSLRLRGLGSYSSGMIVANHLERHSIVTPHYVRFTPTQCGATRHGLARK